jgi:hypothetical protein
LESFAVAKAEHDIHNNDNTSIDTLLSPAGTIIVEVEYYKYDAYKLRIFVRTIHHDKENNRMSSICVDTDLFILVIDQNYLETWFLNVKIRTVNDSVGLKIVDGRYNID